MLEKNFHCLENCARCCEDMPVELLLADMERIAAHLSMNVVEFFDRYCGVYSLPAGETSAPAISTGSDVCPGFPVTIGMPPPCPFLSGKKCRIHEVRPLNCRLFPEKILYNDETEFWKGLYPCMDEGFMLTGSQESGLMVDLEMYRAALEDSCRRIPALKRGISFDDRPAGRLAHGPEESGDCNSREQGGAIRDEIETRKRDYAVGIIRKELQRLYTVRENTAREKEKAPRTSRKSTFSP